MKTKTGLLKKLALTSLLAITFTFPAPLLAADCGSGENAVKLSIDIGCRGQGNPIFDMLGAFSRFLAAGVGIVIVLMIIIAGIQYITSSGNPQALAAAKGRLANAVIALLIFIFAWAILSFLIPGPLNLNP